jgi:hypothetical protein
MISRRHMMVASTALALQQPVLGSTLPTWQRLPTEPYRGKQDDIAFVSPDSGWYGNGDGKLYRTIDGGQRWEKVWEQRGTFIRALGFVDSLHGYLGNVGTEYYPGVTDTRPLYRTLDGGGRDAGRGVNQCLSLKCRREKNKGIANISPVAELSSTLPQTP